MTTVKTQSLHRGRTASILSILLIVVCLGLIIHRAWLCDDAFITFRTLDNAVHGYHLTWNVYERVQGYTHPLWLFLLIPFYALTHEIYITVISISVILAAAALVLMYRSTDDKRSLILPLLVLAFSNAYIDYSTSGLENSLLNFLLALSMVVFLNQKKIKHFSWVFYLVCSLVYLTRMDALLILLPAVAFVFFTDPRRFGLKLLELLAGFLPVLIWEAFSLFYYGFPFPNTFYAKLTAGLPLAGYLIRGVAYFYHTITADPVTFLGLLLGGLFFVVSPKRLRPFSFGILLYFLYLLSIGGDFMSGRMYASLLFVAVFLFAQYQAAYPLIKQVGLAVVVVLLGFFAACPTPLLNSSAEITTTVFRIVDERRAYSPGTGLFRNQGFYPFVSPEDKICGYCDFQSILTDRASGAVKSWPPKVLSNIGFQGYYSGPDARLIDALGLTDALIARLPARRDADWRVGHLYRDIPEGYVRYVEDQTNHLRNPGLDEYNSHLAVLTRSNLFAKGRLLEILRFNCGYYDDLLVGNE